ncbi:type II toxin-antitoxin system HicA family toxin [Candidatus Microgenomates bacterium]|nr:type II toxin-antitoxin system HicA family toxin [Candidatus Microgenomates bacterium]
MPPLANISGREAVKAFVRAGYKHVHTSGDHAILQKEGAPTLSIPLHKEVARFLLKTQIKKADLTEKDFIKFLNKNQEMG